ncbi:hypothetical protein BHM03_00018067 [Ensete ventricosum]|nr:hypothetical protein BHM03_00018067 [Ensete ventricosum]
MISVASHEAQPQIPTSTRPPETQPPESIIFRSKLPDIPIPHHLPLHTYCFEKLPELSEAPCIITAATTGKIYSFSETHLLCRRTAAGLSKLGIEQGDAIMVLLQNSPEFIFTFMGGSMLGAMTTAANPFCTPAEIYKQFKTSGAKLVITQSMYVDKLRAVNEGFPEIGDGLIVVTIDAPPADCISFSQLLDSDETAIPDVTIDPEDPVALPFSSGTTGLPKGVMLTHKSLVSSIAQQVDGENPNLYLKGDDVVLCVLPLFHIFALNSVLLCSLRAGAATMLMPKFEIATMLEGIQRHRVSVAAVVPPLVLALAKNPVVEKYDLTSVRIILSGAAPLGKELEEALRSRVPQAILGQVRLLSLFQLLSVHNNHINHMSERIPLFKPCSCLVVKLVRLRHEAWKSPFKHRSCPFGYGMTEAGPVLSMCPAFAKQPTAVKSGSCGTVVPPAELESLLISHPSIVDAAVVP